MHPALQRLQHRPWEVPRRPWRWRQSWCDLLFAHWPVPASALRPLVPPTLAIQEHGGTSWIGVVPFRMQGVMRRPLPNLPWISRFLELNVRLYVERDGKPGVWFLSLDAANPLAVWGGRRFFLLPYQNADMTLSISSAEDRVYRSVRREHADDAHFAATYRPASAVYQARSGSLEHWLTERYCLYSQSSRGVLYRAEVHHRPWPLQSAEVRISENSLFVPHGLEIPAEPTLVHFASRLDVVVWSLERVAE